MNHTRHSDFPGLAHAYAHLTPGKPPHPSLRKPVTIVGGFLGAGKTTLLNHIVRQNHGMPMELIIREYGSVAVDDKLIEDRSLKIQLVTGSYIHTDPQHQLFWAMENLYSRCDRLGIGRFSWQDVDFDYLLLESSGLDMPETPVLLFFLDRLRDHYRLDSYTLLMDAEYGELNLDEYRVAREQVAFADVILLNKVDLVEERRVSSLERRLRRINSVARIHRTEYARVDLDRLLNVRLFERVPGLFELGDLSAPARGPRASWGEHMDEISTVVLSEKRPMDKDKVNEWINDLFMSRGHKILRSKGFLDFAGSDHRFVFQGVRKTFHSKADRLWEHDEERGSVIVLIGEGLDDAEQLQESFRACVAQTLSVSTS